ncbi:MAG: hypothetical protein AMXMBFR58_02470 [Phycisphaerae bacterium]
MGAGERERMREIFDQVRRLPKEQRGAFLDALPAADAPLRAQIEDMVAALDEAGRFLAEPTCDGAGVASAGTVDPPLRETPGTRIGPYKLLQLIGEGGFGSVFMAEQEKPVSRKVALKIIKLGMDTRQVIARFEAERQALALMDHPHIAKVLDAGATETGRPYFVMELCKGDPIVEYCDKNNLSIPDRLELFSQVCTAVQHAHTKGIIHRDLKPTNILVSTQDGRPHARVIDFGIAKATASKLTEKTLFTEHRQLIGTPEYMSPEQAEGSLDIDTRTDVYSLGVVLYELLTGTTPFSSEELRSAAYAEIQRIIREVEPPRPSTRLSMNTDTLASVAARRLVEPRRLGTIVRGELDWIVMKALEKDRQRRYETANGLAMDVRRYLAGEAVLAAPPSRAYRLRKFVRRHRAGVVLASALTTTVVLGLIGTSVGLAWAVRERDRADDAARAASAAQIVAQERSRDLEKVVSFQAAQLSGVDVMQMGIRFRQDLMEGIRRAGASANSPAATIEANLAAADAALVGIDLTGVARSALENGILRPSIDAISREFNDQPGVRADLLLSVSESSRRLGLFEFAVQPGRDAFDLRTAELGPADAKTLNARMRAALLAKDLGKLDDAEAQLRECLAIAIKEHGEDAKITVDLRANLATALTAQAKFQEAAELYQLALPWLRANAGPRDEETLGCMASLASALSNLKRFDEAEPLFRESVEGFRSLYGTGNLRSIQALNNFAGFYRAKSDYTAALATYEEALGAARPTLGDDHWLTLILTDNIGGVRFAQSDAEGAATYARAALDGRRRVLGENHPATLRSCFNLAKVVEPKGDLQEAISLYGRAVSGFRKVYGEFHSYTVSARTSLAGALMNAGSFQECSELLLEESQLLDAADAPPDRRRAVTRAISILYEKWDAAEPGKGYDAKAAEWKARLAALPAPPEKK